ncbi:MAG: two pore domain potassium channel family protein [Rhodobacteraceae bacterium]|nr:MAG: two pore domain potassium channel family protein [Paracoccaceae bacterium]
MMSRRGMTLLAALASIIAGGTVFFRHVEGWSWVDAYFFTVVTLSTVGYGTPVPETTLGKIATTVFIFVGLGIFALAIQQFAAYSLEQRERKGGPMVRWLIRRRRSQSVGAEKHGGDQES